jgi:hypothetical protein
MGTSMRKLDQEAVPQRGGGAGATRKAPRWTRAWPIALVLVTAFLVGDLVDDVDHDSSAAHVAFDVVAIVIAGAGLAGAVEYFRGRRG